MINVKMCINRCWYYPKPKDAVETWLTCTAAPGRLSGMILATAETQRTLEKSEKTAKAKEVSSRLRSKQPRAVS